ncbi:endonuclease III [candidate division NPL-UPA2 bacterium Unc8]|uniref:Endonuclease III n=1 Tax=candidate division NPL-UPA2 bacterium Unc8 TaxID=1980939 RepID=A0A399G081_UNCN2|nr:Endonuclease III [Bacillota bacterium]MBT9137622.1 Endonuclease III [Bacillota bacterium]MBT9147267.1 Endonuclease III [Bacillota bacterium]RII01109.1 MAG: endonuclease III [candidate division NPL-UPA2 bacterium Unc8]
MLQEKIAKIIKILRKTYPESRTALHYETPLQILVATILAAQCTDERVNKITPHLFSKYKTVFDFAEAKQSILEREIRTAGFYRNKAKNIIAAAKKIVESFNGNVPQSMNELVALPGVARKTANIVLSSSFKKTEGIAVDTHVKRLSRRMGLSKEKNPDKIEQDLMRIVPKKDWIDFNYMFVDHGRKACRARKPLCQECEVKHLCSATPNLP